MPFSAKASVLHTRDKFYMSVHPASDPADNFSHGKGRKDRSDPQAFDMSQKRPCHKDCHCQTGYIKADLYPGISSACILRNLPRKKVCGNNGHFATVYQSNPKADHKIAETEIQNLEENSFGKKLNPAFVDIHRYAKEKSNHKTQ